MSNKLKTIQDRAIFVLAVQQKVIYGLLNGTISMTLNDPYPCFDTEYLRNSTRYRHRFNGILIATYIRPTQQCHFE